jgi:uncharacterized protein YvpB
MAHILNVPMVLQKQDYGCGPACEAMVLAYHGKDVDYDALEKSFDINRDGIIGLYLPEIGSYFLEQNYDVTIQTFNPHLYSTSDIGKSQQELHDHYVWLKEERFKDEYHQKKYDVGLTAFAQFMEAGGEIDLRIPTEADLHAEIARKCPAIISITNRFMNEARPYYNMHFVTLIGDDDSGFYVNDPSELHSKGEMQRYDASHMMYGIIANAGGDIDNCSILKLKPRL